MSRRDHMKMTLVVVVLAMAATVNAWVGQWGWFAVAVVAGGFFAVVLHQGAKK